MKRNLLMLFCILALVTTCLASCNNKNHTHTFSSDWESDATNHWHAATCEHGENKDSLAAHVDANEDGACDVCAYASGHIHTYESEWTYDDNNHWKVATCSHSDEKGELSLHLDDDVDGSCDVCGGHVHNVNGAGYCKIDGCGKKVKEIDETSLDELMAAIYDQRVLVNGGHIDYGFVGRSNSGVDYTVDRSEIVDYIFGKDNYTYKKVVTNAINGTNEADSLLETWTQLSGPEDTFGIYSENEGETYQLDISDVGKLEGYYIALSTLAGEYGVESTLYALYEAAISDDTTDLEVIPNTDNNEVTFSYNYKTVFVNETEVAVGDENTPAGTKIYNVNYFEVKVTVKYTDDYALTDLIFVCDCYTNDPGTANGGIFLYDDVDIQYDPDTDTFIFVKYDHDTKTYLPTDERTPDTYTITISQTIGERTEENPNPKSKFVPKSYELYLNIDAESGALSKLYSGEILEADTRDILNFYVGNCTPDGTSLHFVADYVSFKVYKDNVEVVNPEDYLNEIAVAMFTFAGEQRLFFFVPKEEGAYRFEIYLMGEMTHEITVHVGVVDEEFIEIGDNEFAVKIQETYAWTNEVSFTATEAGTYYFNLPAGIGFVNADAYDAAEETPATDDSPAPYFDFQQFGNENGGSFSLTLEEGQTIRFYVSGAKRGTYVISYFVF